MNPVEKGIVRRKLTVIVENLKALEPIKDMTGDEYMRDFYMRKATERLLQEIIEAAVDINTHIIVQIGHTVPDDYFGTFIKAGELKIISTDLAEKLAPSAGLRNRLVHEYDLIDHSLVLEAVRMVEEFYSEYVKEIEDYISK